MKRWCVRQPTLRANDNKKTPQRPQKKRVVMGRQWKGGMGKGEGRNIEAKRGRSFATVSGTVATVPPLGGSRTD